MQPSAVASGEPAPAEFPVHPPAELRVHRAGPRVLVVFADLEESARGLDLLEPGGIERHLRSAAGPRGRTRTAVVPFGEGGERLHLRPIRHGGLLRGLLRDFLPGIGRQTRELRVTAALHARCAPVPRPALVVGRRRFGPVWSAVVGTVYEDGTVDGEDFLSQRPDRDRLLCACAAAGSAVRRFHRLGGRHRDLHVKNLLVRERGDDTEVLLVDLDRARLAEPPSPRQRMTEIMRLQRSLVKRSLAETVGSEGRAAFLEAYTEGDEKLRSALLAHLPRERRRLAWHRLGHRLGLT